jgi:hypothetical protein
MKVLHNGRGLTVEFTELEVCQLKNLVQDYVCEHVLESPRWMWQLDAAIVAKQNDNRRQIKPQNPE